MLKNAIEYIPVFEGEQTLKDLLTSLIVDKILCKNFQKAIPQNDEISYNVFSVPQNSEVPGLCKGVS